MDATAPQKKGKPLKSYQPPELTVDLPHAAIAASTASTRQVFIQTIEDRYKKATAGHVTQTVGYKALTETTWTKPPARRTFSPLPAKQNSSKSIKRLLDEKALALPSRMNLLPIRRPPLDQKFNVIALTARWESEIQDQKENQSPAPEEHEPTAEQTHSIVPSKREASEIDQTEPTFFIQSQKPAKQQKQYAYSQQSQSTYSYAVQPGRSTTLFAQMRKIAPTSSLIDGSHYTAPSASPPMAAGNDRVLSHGIDSLHCMSAASLSSTDSLYASGRSVAPLAMRSHKNTATSPDLHAPRPLQDIEHAWTRRVSTPDQHLDTAPDTTAYSVASEDENGMAGPDLTFSDFSDNLLKDDPYSTLETIDTLVNQDDYSEHFEEAQDDNDDDTQSAKDSFYAYQQKCFRMNDSKFSRARGIEKSPSDMEDTIAPEQTEKAASPDLTVIAQHTVPANNCRRRSARKPPAPKLADVDSSRKGPAVKRKKRGPVPAPKSITPLDSYLYVPDDTDPTARRLEPLKALGPQEAQTLLTALESLWGHNEKYFRKACTITNPSNHETYVAQKKCLAHHIVWNNSKKKGDASKWADPFACSSCTNSPCRPCVKLEWHPEDPNGTQNAILVFYPRPESSRPSDATWRDAGFYLPT